MLDDCCYCIYTICCIQTSLPDPLGLWSRWTIYGTLYCKCYLGTLRNRTGQQPITPKDVTVRPVFNDLLVPYSTLKLEPGFIFNVGQFSTLLRLILYWRQHINLCGTRSFFNVGQFATAWKVLKKSKHIGKYPCDVNRQWNSPVNRASEGVKKVLSLPFAPPPMPYWLKSSTSWWCDPIVPVYRQPVNFAEKSTKQFGEQFRRGGLLEGFVRFDP